MKNDSLQFLQSKTSSKKIDERFAYFAKINPFFAPKEENNIINPKTMVHLLDKKKHLRDPRFQKSRPLYWIPLFILILIFLRYFK